MRWPARLAPVPVATVADSLTGGMLMQPGKSELGWDDRSVVPVLQLGDP